MTVKRIMRNNPLRSVLLAVGFLRQVSTWRLSEGEKRPLTPGHLWRPCSMAATTSAGEYWSIPSGFSQRPTATLGECDSLVPSRCLEKKLASPGRKFHLPLCVLSHFSRVQLFVIPWTVARQAPLSMGFSRQEYWSGLPFSPPGNLPDPGIRPAPLTSPALAGGFFTTSTAWFILSFCDNWPVGGVDFTVSHILDSARSSTFLGDLDNLIDKFKSFI